MNIEIGYKIFNSRNYIIILHIILFINFYISSGI